MVKVEFCEEVIKYDNQELKYSDLQSNKDALFELLEYCVLNEKSIEFISDTKCCPFGQQLRDIFEQEFHNDNSKTAID